MKLERTCRTCKDRHDGCEADCPIHKMIVDMERAKRKENKTRREEYTVDNYVSCRIYKTRKITKRRGGRK